MYSNQYNILTTSERMKTCYSDIVTNKCIATNIKHCDIYIVYISYISIFNHKQLLNIYISETCDILYYRGVSNHVNT